MYAEDPGAANYLSGLPQALAERGLRVVTFAAGTALEMLGASVPDLHPYPSSPAVEIIRQVRPRVLVVGTAEDPATPGLALVAAARAEGIPTVGAVDGLPSAAHRFRGGSAVPLAYAPDRIVVPDDATRAAFLELGCTPGRVFVCGHPHFDTVIEARDRLDRVGRSALRAAGSIRADGRLVVVFAAEISSGLDPTQYRKRPEYTLSGRGTSQARTEIVLEEFLDAVAGIRPRPYLVLRLHPKNEPGELDGYRTAFDHVSAGPGLHELLYCADALVGMTSIVIAEAAIMGTPTLSIVPRRSESEWSPTVALGITPCASTPDEVRAEVRALLARAAEGHRHAWEPPRGSVQCVADVVVGSYARGRA